MRASFFILTAGMYAANATLFPTGAPTITRDDPYQCATADIAQYFDDMPKPTGNLETALQSWASVLEAELPCTLEDFLNCQFPAPSRWCGFSTAAPPQVLPDWTTYANAAAAWWAQQSSGATSIASQCPQRWYTIQAGTLGAALWMNQTIFSGECIADANPTAGAPGAMPTPTATTPRPAGGPNEPSTPTPTATLAGNDNRARGQSGLMGQWLVMCGASLAIAANSIL